MAADLQPVAEHGARVQQAVITGPPAQPEAHAAVFHAAIDDQELPERRVEDLVGGGLVDIGRRQDRQIDAKAPRSRPQHGAIGGLELVQLLGALAAAHQDQKLALGRIMIAGLIGGLRIAKARPPVVGFPHQNLCGLSPDLRETRVRNRIGAKTGRQQARQQKGGQQQRG